ncbi:MAG: STY4851/ECs_5259 family protein, partial [Deltaproteobacteria bacterium]|nr:STY4851/ECs_5259 family protein [Deltaproteobacteria bacterium]
MSMSIAEKQIQEVLAAQGLTAPDQRPLFRYRMATPLWEQARTALQLLARTRGAVNFTPCDAGLLCLYVAEWWRREHRGGAWKWEGVLSRIGLHESAPELYPVFERGLRYWGRHVRRRHGRRLFLMTLALEGGFPLHLIKHEGAHLRRYFRGLFRELSIYGTVDDPLALGQRCGELLPMSFRNDQVFSLAGELVQEIWRLQSLVAGSSAPLEELDRQQLKWRDSLPLNIDDDAARELLKGLVDDVAKVEHEGKPFIGTAIVLRTLPGRAFRLERDLRVATAAKLSEVAQLLGATSAELPPRLWLRLLMSGRPPQRVALMSKISEKISDTDTDTERSRIEALTTEPLAFDAAATEPCRVDAVGGGLIFASVDLIGEVNLGELPWVFRPDGEGQKSSLALLGQGGLRSRAKALWIALAGDQEISALDESGCEELGVIQGVDRRVFRVTGQGAKISDADSSTMTIRCGAPSEDHASYHLRGETLPFQRSGRHPLYRGWPQLYRSL